MMGEREDLDRLADLLSGIGPERLEKALRKSTAIHIRTSEADKQSIQETAKRLRLTVTGYLLGLHLIVCEKLNRK